MYEKQLDTFVPNNNIYFLQKSYAHIAMTSLDFCHCHIGYILTVLQDMKYCPTPVCIAHMALAFKYAKMIHPTLADTTHIKKEQLIN